MEMEYWPKESFHYFRRDIFTCLLNIQTSPPTESRVYDCLTRQLVHSLLTVCNSRYQTKTKHETWGVLLLYIYMRYHSLSQHSLQHESAARTSRSKCSPSILRPGFIVLPKVTRANMTGEEKKSDRNKNKERQMGREQSRLNTKRIRNS